MTFPKLLAIIATVLFSVILLAALFRGCHKHVSAQPPASQTLKMQGKKETTALKKKKQKLTAIATAQPVIQKEKEVVAETEVKKNVQKSEKTAKSDAGLPDANRIEELFNKEGTKLPIVETITYKSRVSWLKGRPAWLSDYASHYHTPRHFIARSLHGKPDYLNQDLVEGARFNVYRLDKNIRFHLLIDLSRCKMWLYYDDLDQKERVLLKTYHVTLGRPDGKKTSGYLTPLGHYSLGNKVAIYKEKVMGHYQGKQIEMMTVFGTRWVPFDKEIKGCTSPAKGFGIHGVPFVKGKQDLSSIGCYESDGCIRMKSEDVEEVFAIIISKPAEVEIVKDFNEASPPRWQ